jgi:hypothetical protein
MIDTSEKLAIHILGQERYDNSPCQAHPYELIAEYVNESKIEAYNKGFKDALYAYSWMVDGVAYVGTCGKTYKTAIKEVDAGTHYNYNPLKMESM